MLAAVCEDVYFPSVLTAVLRDHQCWHPHSADGETEAKALRLEGAERSQREILQVSA